MFSEFYGKKDEKSEFIFVLDQPTFDNSLFNKDTVSKLQINIKLYGSSNSPCVIKAKSLTLTSTFAEKIFSITDIEVNFLGDDGAGNLPYDPVIL